MNKVAIIYDFDKTLCNKNMQEYSLLPKLNIEANSFWKEVGILSKESDMDSILSYMYLLLSHAKANGFKLTRQFFMQFGSDIDYYPGVEDYFERINQYGLDNDIEIQHYVISSGTSEIIEGSSIYNKFKKVFACRFHYDENGEAVWPAVSINYTGKTQFLFRINKNSLDVSDNTKINDKKATRDIPFDHMIYIADGMTDVPCMQLVKNNGGYSIAVHEDDCDTCRQLLEDKRVNYIADADYRDNSQLDLLLKNIIKKISIEDSLKKYQ